MLCLFPEAENPRGRKLSSPKPFDAAKKTTPSRHCFSLSSQGSCKPKPGFFQELQVPTDFSVLRWVMLPGSGYLGARGFTVTFGQMGQHKHIGLSPAP